MVRRLGDRTCGGMNGANSGLTSPPVTPRRPRPLSLPVTRRSDGIARNVTIARARSLQASRGERPRRLLDRFNSFQSEDQPLQQNECPRDPDNAGCKDDFHRASTASRSFVAPIVV